MRRSYLVAIAIAAYLVFLVTRIPAHFAYDLVKERLPNLALGELDGTVWQGTAGSVVYNGIRAGSLDWDTRPLRFLLGEWNAAIETRGPLESLADIAYSLTGTLSVTNASVTTRLSDLRPFYPQLSIMALEGAVSSRIDSLELEDAKLLEIHGSATVDNLSAGALQLGDFTAEMRTDDEGTRKLVFASVGSGGLDVEGEVLLNQQEAITLDLLVSNPEHLGDLGGLFRKFSSKEPDGYRFRWEGEFDDLKKYM